MLSIPLPLFACLTICKGPVRGVSFHPTQPLFVSGGDDYKIKVWNYKQRRCLFTLLGHLDYIRTVEFHREYPWILSCSDDQTIRIWNWQSRTCIAVLTGHNHYVMCASFHPKEDLVVSASLDQTVRVWDISGLRKKNVSPAGGMTPSSMHGEDSLRLPQNELFGNTDAIVKYVLEGHDRGVNWAAFHPTSPLIVSGADDRQVKLWRMNDTKAWEVDTFRGHFNNVSCAIFHPRQELILSNSEDKTIRVWDLSKRTGIQTFRREHDRFWILTAHPEQNLFAAGHDSGMLVFKLERERPPHTSFNNELLFYIKDKYLRTCEFSSGRDIPVLSIRSSKSSSSSSSSNAKIKSLSYSPQDRSIIISNESEGGFYELYTIPKDSRNSDSVESKKGIGLSAVFIARDRFAVLDKSQQIIVKNCKNEETKRVPTPYPVDTLFSAPLGQLLLRGEDKVILYDIQQRKSVCELSVSDVRIVYWSNTDKNPLVALISKENITIANRKLEQLCTIHESIKVKSGAFDDNGVFLYSTLNHIKYCLPNGDNGIIRTIDTALYITAVRGNKVYCLDRDGKNRVISIDTTEYLFKFALIQRKFSQVLKMVKEYNLMGQSIISYLQKKGFPEVALHFVKDEKTRFNLALECGNIEVALESAKVLDDKECWHRLGVEALRQGNHQIVEMAYQRTKNFERLSFLYLITGNVDKLRKMLKISEMRGDVMSRFHNSLYLGDIVERIKLLEEAGQLSLAYVTALSHNLTDIAETIKTKLPSDIEIPESTLTTSIQNAKLLFPAIPIMKLHESNWPLLTVSKGYFEGPLKEEDKKFNALSTPEDIETTDASGWDDMNLEDEDNKSKSKDFTTEEELDNSATKDEEGVSEDTWEVSLDLGADVEPTPTTTTAASTAAASKDRSFVVLPSNGPTVGQIWQNNSNLAVDHCAAGSFDSAMRLLSQQVGVVNFAPLKPYFMNLFSASRGHLLTIPAIPALSSALYRNSNEISSIRQSLPQLSVSLQSIIDESLKSAYKSFAVGPSKFTEALQLFTSILHSLLFIIVDSKKEIAEVKELIGLCREYIVGLKLELLRKDTTDPARQLELAAYFTHCNIQQVHLLLSLRSAMSVAYKVKNFLSASSFARRLLEFDPAKEVADQARKVVKLCEQTPENAHKISYDERNPFFICGFSFTPIYKGTPSIQCPYCSAHYLPEHKDKVCNICGIAQIGKATAGIQLVHERVR